MCGICKVATRLCGPCLATYEALPIWGQAVVIFIFVFIPCLVLHFFAAQALDQAYYG